MESPNQSTAKTFLNATIYNGESRPKPVEIDITDILEANGVNNFYSINGISRCEFNIGEDRHNAPVEAQFVVTESQLMGVADGIRRLIDASIVNAKQAEALKGLAVDVVRDLVDDCWDAIRE